MTTKTIEIRLVERGRDKIFHVKAIDEDRLTHYGFGTFMENIDPLEIDITSDALEELLAQPERNGLQGLEFWPDNRMAWGCPDSEIFVHPDAVNVPRDAKKWIRKISIKVER
ncbi:hypothetical protein LCGC14_2124600 [marine sediment metagenome]|uniref:Uncharacterized protein n=1 Tax=marine sediment metagenome TaxID=412755 RepID=A0A0F9GZH3_9ZZZZ